MGALHEPPHSSPSWSHLVGSLPRPELIRKMWLPGLSLLWHIDSRDNAGGSLLEIVANIYFPSASTLLSPPLRGQQSRFMMTQYSKGCFWILHWALDIHTRVMEGKTSAMRSENAVRECTIVRLRAWRIQGTGFIQATEFGRMHTCFGGLWNLLYNMGEKAWTWKGDGSGSNPNSSTYKLETLSRLPKFLKIQQ